ncbi:MAG: type II secretion system protein [Candidatus Saccharimonadales bacterium]
MSLSNINTMKKNSGFTIVELLIVIVVIGILAAITIVAYNGVQARATTTKNQANAKEVQSKAEVFAADNDGAYPATAADFPALPATSALSGPVKTALTAGTTNAPSATYKGNIAYKKCGTTEGFQVTYWQLAPTATVVTLNGGDTSTCT